MSVRSVIAVLGGMIIMFFLVEAIEPPTVALLAAHRPAGMDDYLAARTEPAVLAGRAAVFAVTGLLAGYMVAKIAGEYELAHAGVAFALQAVLMFRAFAADPAASLLPWWIRAGLVLTTGVAMLLGAAVRARAARFAPTHEVKP